MAIVNSAPPSTFARVPFIKPPDSVRQVTAMPRAVVLFVVNASFLDAKPINDQQTLQVLCNLPLEFAYRLIDIEIRVRQDVAFAWQFGGELNVTNGIRGQPGLTTHHSMTATESFSFSPITQQTHWVVQRPPTYIMQSITSGVSCFNDYRLVNNTAPAGAAGTVDFLARYYEYDIEQAQMFPPIVPGALTYQLNA